MAREFAKSLAECGIQIVSGMAAGVDAAGIRERRCEWIYAWGSWRRD